MRVISWYGKLRYCSFLLFVGNLKFLDAVGFPFLYHSATWNLIIRHHQEETGLLEMKKPVLNSE